MLVEYGPLVIARLVIHYFMDVLHLLLLLLRDDKIILLERVHGTADIRESRRMDLFLRVSLSAVSDALVVFAKVFAPQQETVRRSFPRELLLDRGCDAAPVFKSVGHVA